MSDKTCPKCGGPMAEGWIHEEGSRSVFPPYTVPVAYLTAWMPGKPNVDAKGQVEWEKGMEKSLIPITVLRCEECGYLESYAHSP